VLVLHKPELWGHLYRTSDRPRFNYRFQTMLDFVFVARLNELIEEMEPDWVVCTHSLPQPRLAFERRKHPNFRVGVVVTDLYPHRMWLRGDPDHYFVPGEWTKALLEQRKPEAKGRISVTGIPINPVFGLKQSPCEAREQLGLDPELPTMVLTAGGIGGGPVEKAVAALMSLSEPCQLVVVCGRNETLLNRLEEHSATFSAESKVTLILKGHVPQGEMAALMRASDFLIGKPGGLTMSECLATGCPFVIYLPVLIPGQEEGNARFLQESGAGVAVDGPAELRQVAEELLHAPERLASMRQASLKVARPNAAADIARLLCEL
jgi:processive 1,2-diacylglycerol beta-glucosyltransferase